MADRKPRRIPRRAKGPDIHEPYGDEHATLIYAKDQAKALIHISQRAPIGTGPLLCPGCGNKVYGVRPKKAAWHYRHEDEQIRSGGCGGLETYVHMLAKQILEKAGGVQTPPVIHRWKNGSQETVRSQERFVFDRVEIEPWADGRRPDLRVHGRIGPKGDTRTLWIEVAVTHRCPEDKIIHIAREGVTALEIDLSKLSGHDEEAIGRALLSGDNRYWLHNQDLVDWLDGKDKELTQHARKILDAVRQTSDDAPSGAALAAHSAARVLGLEDWIGLPVGPTPGFRAPPALWQAKLLDHLLIAPMRAGRTIGAFRPLDGIRPLTNELAPALRGTFKEELRDKLHALNGGFFPTPLNVIGAYIDQLAEKGFLSKDKTVQLRAVQDIRARLQKQTETADRLAEIRSRVSALLDAPSHSFLDAWLEKPVMNGRSVRDHAQDDGRVWDTLLATIAQLERMKAQRIPASALLGLPLEDLLATTTREAATLEDERQAEEALSAARRADERVRTLEARAVALIGQQAAERWLSAPVIHSASPRSHAREDDEALARMTTFLGHHADELAEQARRQAKSAQTPFATRALARIREIMTSRTRL